MLYNQRSLLTYQQDPNLKSGSKWVRYEYDSYGREKRSGFVTSNPANGSATVSLPKP